MGKPKVGIFGLTSCAGEQIVILNCEDQLLDIVGAIDLIDFETGMSNNDEESPLDIALVEGSVVSPRDEEKLKKIRKRSSLLIAIGTCAVWGGIPAMRNEIPREQLKYRVYGREGSIFKSIPAQPLSSFVNVDFNISGCPMEKNQFVQAVASLLHGDIPLLPKYAICTECKLKENICLLKDKNQPCMGPITLAGCDARCPSLNEACIGCRGPVEEANIASEVDILKEKGFIFGDINMKLKTFAAPAEAIKSFLNEE